MPHSLRKLTIFAASPNDVSGDRDALMDIVNELNRGVAGDRGIILELVTWHNVVPDMGRAEQVILDQIGDFDIFVGIMARRFGTSTGKYEAGTEEEFYVAYNRFVATGKPRIMFYFSVENAPPPRTAYDLDQMAKVLKFQDAIRDKGLYREYRTHDEFVTLVRQDLTAVVIKWDRPQKVDSITEAIPLNGRFWPVWRDATVDGRMPAESVETSLYRTAKHSVKFMTISGRSIYSGPVETALKSKPNEFLVKLLLFDWNSPRFSAKMRDERRQADAEIELARRKARDIAQQFLLASQGSRLRIEIKLYGEYPVWRLLIIDGERAFVGYYPHDKRGYEGPMTLFEAADEVGLFYPVNQYFDMLWDGSGPPLRDGDSRFKLAPLESLSQSS